jgi:uncharacterized membrane protein
MSKEYHSLYERSFTPYLQAVVVFGGVLLFNGFGFLLKVSGALEISDRFPWMVAASFMLLYAMFNSIFSISATNRTSYWGASIYSFLGLAAASGFLAYLISGIGIRDAGSYWWIYIVVTVGYLVFVSMVGAMRNIVEFAQREEWNQPRFRQKKRR